MCKKHCEHTNSHDRPFQVVKSSVLRSKPRSMSRRAKEDRLNQWRGDRMAKGWETPWDCLLCVESSDFRRFIYIDIDIYVIVR